MEVNPNLTENSTNATTWNTLGTGQSITIYEYTYSGNNTLSSTASRTGKKYWLASRSNYCNSYEVYYNIGFVSTLGVMDAYSVYDSYGSNIEHTNLGFRPVVYLKSSAKLSNYSSTNGYTLSY